MKFGNVKKYLGAVVRRYRHELDLSQEELAEKAHLHRTYIADVERGARNISLETICRLSHALSISAKELMPETCANEEPEESKHHPPQSATRRTATLN